MMNAIKKRLFYGLYDEGDKTMNFPSIQQQGYWRYRKYDDGTIELWAERVGSSFKIANAANGVFLSNEQNMGIPAVIGLTAIHFVDVSLISKEHYDVWSVITKANTEGVYFKGVSPIERDTSEIYKYIYIFGEYERS